MVELPTFTIFCQPKAQKTKTFRVRAAESPAIELGITSTTLRACSTAFLCAVGQLALPGSWVSLAQPEGSSVGGGGRSLTGLWLETTSTTRECRPSASANGGRWGIGICAKAPE